MKRPEIFAASVGSAFYATATFGLLAFLGVATLVACLAGAAMGLLVALVAARLAPARPSEPSELVAPETVSSERGGFAVTDRARGGGSSESRDERTSREIQTALLPRELPHVSGYHFDVHYEPCGALGGDFYDCVPCDDGRLLFTLGDVSGKGASGAIVMAMVQTLFRQQVRHASGPADLLALVNEGFAGTLGKGVFVTAQAAILDPARNRLTLAAAGHPPLLVINPELRRASEVNARGLALGIVGGDAFRNALVETSIDLSPGDSLLFYTDGAVESDAELARGVGESRLLAAAAAAVLSGPEDALSRLRADLWDDSLPGGGGRRDDTTLLLISRRSGSRMNERLLAAHPAQKLPDKPSGAPT